MLALEAGAGNLIRAVTGSAADIEISVSYVDYNSSTFAVSGINGDSPANITTATTTTIITGAASTIRVLKGMSFFNRSATSTTLLIEQTDGTVVEGIAFCTLLQNESLDLTESGIWIHYDANSAPYPSIGNAASQAEMEAGTANDRYVTPLGVNWHPGVAKAWAKHIVSAGVPQMTVTWNVTSVTDSAVCRVAPVIATDFSSANYCITYGFEANTTTYSATTTALIQTIRNATQAGGGFTMDLLEADIGQTTDPAAWHWLAFGDQ